MNGLPITVQHVRVYIKKGEKRVLQSIYQPYQCPLNKSAVGLSPHAALVCLGLLCVCMHVNVRRVRLQE